MLAFCSQGGGLYIAPGGAEAHLSECTVSGNEATYVRARLSETFQCPVGVLKPRWSTDTCVLARAHRDLAFRT